jgi:hypothetical protein
MSSAAVVESHVYEMFDLLMIKPLVIETICQSVSHKLPVPPKSFAFLIHSEIEKKKLEKIIEKAEKFENGEEALSRPQEIYEVSVNFFLIFHNRRSRAEKCSFFTLKGFFEKAKISSDFFSLKRKKKDFL